MTAVWMCHGINGKEKFSNGNFVHSELRKMKTKLKFCDDVG